MLRKLYVPASLKPNGDGFSFRLRNTLATATLTSPPEIHLDGVAIPVAHVSATLAGVTHPATAVSVTAPIALAKGTELEIHVHGRPLPPGAHKIAIKTESKEWETIAFDVDDKVPG